MSEEFDPDNRGQVILYRANGVNVPVEVTYWRRTFWMPQKNIARLFGVNVPAVSKHLANIYAEGELAESATMSEMEIVRNEGGRTVRRTIRFYSLDAIIAVGYRVSSPQATAFRQWATSVLHEYMIKGFALNDDMLKNGNTFGEDYFKELLARVREIRTSEKRLYQQVLAIFQEICTDYDKDSGKALADELCLRDEKIDFTKPHDIFDPNATWKVKTLENYPVRELLEPIFKNGELVYKLPELKDIQAYCKAQQETLWDEVKRFENPHKYYVDLSWNLWTLKRDLLAAAKK